MYVCVCHSFSLSLYRFYFLKTRICGQDHARCFRKQIRKSPTSGKKKCDPFTVKRELKREGKGDERGWIKEGRVRKLQWKESDENNDEKNTSISASTLCDAKPFASRVKIIANNRAAAHHARLWHPELPELLRNAAHEIPKVTISCGVNVNGSRVPLGKQTNDLFTVAQYCILSMR